MPNRTIRHLLAVCCTLALSASAAHAGPPWISVEYPANPHHNTTRGATFLVHTFHHAAHIQPAITATFEGLVDGQRRTVTARVEPTNRTGVYAVRGDVPEDGSWIAVVRMRAGTAPAVALVQLGQDAQVLAVDVPADRTRDGWQVPRDVTEREIGAALRGGMPARTANGGYAGVALAMVVLLGVGRLARRS